VIVDTFTALRELEYAKMKDVNGKCFICGLTADIFEKSGVVSFEKHFKTEHNMWYYIGYVAWIKEKDPLDLDGVEQYIKDLFDAKKVSWIPQMKAMGLENSIEDEQV
jgi:inositol 1,4,5-triphosphate receptor type 1